MKQCPDCGENLADDAVHCGHCGTKVEEEEKDSNKTMFGVGALSDEDLEKAAQQAKKKSENQRTQEGAKASPDGGDGGEFRLPTPGEMGDDKLTQGNDGGSDGSEEQAETTDDGTRLGLKGPTDGDGDASAYAETEALPMVDDDKLEKQQDGASELEGGRLSSPTGEEKQDQQLGSSPDLKADSAPPSGDSSPFVQGDSNQMARSTEESMGPVASNDRAEQASTGPTAGDTTPESQMPSGKQSQGAGATGDTDSSLPGGSPTGDAASPAASPDTGPSETAAESPSGKAASSGAGSDTAPAGVNQGTTSQNPLSDDSRFGDSPTQPDSGGQDQPLAAGGTGSEIGQRPGQGQLQTTDDEGSNKTLLIVVGILGVSLFLCAAVGLVGYFFMT